MAITRNKKDEILSKLGDILKTSESITFVNFHGLGVSDTTDMRQALRAQDVGYVVAKKSLIKKALGETKTKGDVPDLDGEVAVVYGSETAPAREVYAFQQQHKDSLAILGGVFEGAYLNQESMLEIAQIPSLDVLRGMFVNVINSPIQGLAVALNAIAEKKA